MLIKNQVLKTGVVYYKDTDNIGDDVQTLAAKNILRSVDQYLDREALNSYDGEKIKLLCNGYFMKDPSNWPPSENIDPLFVSFHVSSLNECESHMINPSLKAYYQQREPIGCRDKRTMNLFKSQGIDAYYSACLTLTLEAEKDIQSSGEIIFADAFLKQKSNDYESYFIDKMVPSSLKNKVSIIYHEQARNHLSIEERMRTTQDLINRYAAADIVFTSRIHCALPCLALGTPVYFMDLGYDRKGGKSRFDGITDLMHVIEQKHFPFSSSKVQSKMLRKLQLYKLSNTKDLSSLVDWDIAENPKSNVDELKENITNTVKQFFS